MKKLLAILLLAASIFTLASCGSDDEAPEGMQLAYGGENAGYYFYVPEEWIVSPLGDITAAYISKLNTTSVSFTEIKLEGEKRNEDYFFNSYFNENLPELQKTHEFELKEAGKEYTIGTGDYAAERAKQYIYSYKYPSYSYPDKIDDPTVTYHKFTFMQILVMDEGKFYLFTYSALDEAADGAKSNYDTYLEKLATVIENFKFVTPKGTAPVSPEYTVDADGYKLVTDRGLCGFDFYIPADFNVNYSDAIISASHADGSNVNMTVATSTGVQANHYWEMRKKELEAFAENIVTIEENKASSLGNNSSTLYGDWAYEYEYTYESGGEKYHVKQIIALNGSKGYVFTYTAKEANYLLHLDSINKIIEKVNF